MRVLVACEYSGIVRDAFTKVGNYAMSCDLLPTESPGPHYQGDIRDVLNDNWDLCIAHPPCTDLCVSGAKHFIDKKWIYNTQDAAIEFFMLFTKVNIPQVAIENPIGIMSKLYRKPDQIIQPWQYGQGETKATCLWLKNLPLLQPTNIVEGREARIHHIPPGKNRGKLRSLTYQGIADAMAIQWGQ